MKIYCLNCGSCNEYVGLDNKPTSCVNCKENIDGSKSPVSKAKVVKLPPDNKPIRGYSIGGIVFDDFNFLSDLIESSSEPEEKEQSKKSVSKKKRRKA